MFSVRSEVHCHLAPNADADVQLQPILNGQSSYDGLPRLGPR